MTTIEHHYNALRSASHYARSLVGRDWSARSLWIYHAELAARVIARANELAAADWPRRRSELAASGEALPLGPVTYGASGYSGVSLDGSSVLQSRQRIDGDVNYAELAIADLQPALEREAEAAESAWEAYRRAVEQGVAIAPDSAG